MKESISLYTPFNTVILSIITNFLLNINVTSILEYFSCESKGWVPSNSTSFKCDKELQSVVTSVTPIPTAITIAILAILPAVNLV